jgi:hypothetical protein
MNAAEVIQAILSHNPEIRAISLFDPTSLPLVQDRLGLAGEGQRLIEMALDLKRRYHLPFWDGLLVSALNTERTPLEVIRAASQHNRSRNLTRLEVNDWILDDLRSLALKPAGAGMIAISSVVDLQDGSQRHIPMVDFHCPASPSNLKLAEAVANELNVGPGFILASGKSYHFYGLELINGSELASFLGRALLFAPIVDRAWIAHQLIESACALRISPRAETGEAPHVVARIETQQ